MKILHVIDSSGLYGAEVMLMHLMQAQKGLGYEPVLCSIRDLDTAENPLEIKARRNDLVVRSLPMRRGYSLNGAIALNQIAFDESTDIVHSHGYKSDILLGSVPTARQRLPFIRTLHGWTSTSWRSRIWFYEWLDIIFLRRAEAIVKVTRECFRRIRYLALKGKKVFCVENGICELELDANVMANEDRSFRRFFEDAFVIGTIGRLSHEKGIEFLIQSMIDLKTCNNNLKLVVLGDGEDKAKLTSMIYKEALDDKILLAGYRNNATDYLPFFDLFVLPSLTEGLPITILEAMQAERPIVATRVGGIPEVLGNGRYGVLVEPGNSKALADAVLDVRRNPNMACERAKEARKLALTRYSSDRMAKEYQRVYEYVLGETN